MLREGHGYCDTCGERCDLNSIYRVGNTDLCVPCWADSVVLFGECFPDILPLPRTVYEALYSH